MLSRPYDSLWLETECKEIIDSLTDMGLAHKLQIPGQCALSDSVATQASLPEQDTQNLEEKAWSNCAPYQLQGATHYPVYRSGAAHVHVTLLDICDRLASVCGLEKRSILLTLTKYEKQIWAKSCPSSSKIAESVYVARKLV